MFCEFEMDYNTTELTRMICFVKGEDAVDHRIVSRWFKEFRLGCRNPDCQQRSGGSQTVLEEIEVILSSSTRRVSGELEILHSSVVRHFLTLGKSICSC